MDGAFGVIECLIGQSARAVTERGQSAGQNGLLPVAWAQTSPSDSAPGIVVLKTLVPPCSMQ